MAVRVGVTEVTDVLNTLSQTGQRDGNDLEGVRGVLGRTVVAVSLLAGYAAQVAGTCEAGSTGEWISSECGIGGAKESYWKSGA